MGLVGTVGRGKLAGALGTLAMDAVLYWRYRRDGGSDSVRNWEFATNVKDWSTASAPAQFGRKVASSVVHKELPPESAAPLTNVVHWSTGMAWGAAYALLSGSRGRSHVLAPGLLFGIAVWATSYVVLPLAKVYKPIWEYDGDVLWKDLSAHLTYGVTTAAVFRTLTR
ncbi:MAG TPA: hypothetical protein VM121_03775 [Acidimicrobiales bacterium]|nr:hypothetical protein [Acidimicrobiales bacterium]